MYHSTVIDLNLPPVPKMKALSIDDCDFIRNVFERHPPVFSEFTFSNLFMWKENRHTFFCEIDNTVIFLIQDAQENYLVFGPPFGPLSLDQVIPKLPVKVEKAVRTSLPTKEIPGWEFSTSPDDADYVYKVSDLIEFPDHLYHRKRQLMRGCLSRYDCQYEELHEENIYECRQLQKRLFEESDQTESSRQEHIAAERLIENIDHFDVFGGVIRINRQVEGFMIGKTLNATTAVGHVEKTNPEIHGLSTLMHHWFAKYSLESYEYFNVEQDLGLPGLRQSKSSFFPDHMVVKWEGNLVHNQF
ncbi:MAG: hypothetical protein K940chlam3_00540 [Chlamydiae bacterium]|nr:hypothetical protein [Chlamydiota bacterium]